MSLRSVLDEAEKRLDALVHLTEQILETLSAGAPAEKS